MRKTLILLLALDKNTKVEKTDRIGLAQGYLGAFVLFGLCLWNPGGMVI